VATGKRIYQNHDSINTQLYQNKEGRANIADAAIINALSLKDVVKEDGK
jgi:hypothetical protein